MVTREEGLSVVLSAPLNGVCKIVQCRRESTLYADLRYCECCPDTDRMCFKVHPKSMGIIDKTEVCDEHGAQVRKWNCLVRIYTREAA